MGKLKPTSVIVIVLCFFSVMCSSVLKTPALSTRSLTPTPAVRRRETRGLHVSSSCVVVASCLSLTQTIIHVPVRSATKPLIRIPPSPGAAPDSSTAGRDQNLVVAAADPAGRDENGGLWEDVWEGNGRQVCAGELLLFVWFPPWSC